MSVGTLTVGPNQLQIWEIQGKPNALRIKATFKSAGKIDPLAGVGKGSSILAKFNASTPPSGKYAITDYYTQFETDGSTTWNLVLRYQGK